jgi:hypothetical protein
VSGLADNGCVDVGFATAGWLSLGFAGAGVGALVRAAGAGATTEVGLFSAGDRNDSLGCCEGGNTPEAGRDSLATFSAFGRAEFREGEGRGAPSGSAMAADGGQVLRAGDFAGCSVNCDSLERERFVAEVDADSDVDGADDVERATGPGVLARGGELGASVFERDELGAGVLERAELGPGVLARA